MIQEDTFGVRHPVAFFSRKFIASELKWATRDKECRALLDAILHWSAWLKNRYFTVETDHHSLQRLRSQRDTMPRQERLLDVLSEYDFDIKFVLGKENGGVLSRFAELHSTSPQM